jgi:hypothetical protein
MADQHIEMVIADSGGNAIATIGGNTGDMVAYRTRYKGNVVGYIALDEAGQNAPGSVPVVPKEILTMGMSAASLIPGSKYQTKGPWKGRKPFVGAVKQASGKTDLVGFNGAVLANGQSAFGLSIVHLGKLNKPITVMQPEQDAAGNYKLRVIGLAEDGGTFSVKVSVKYG